MMLFAKAIFQPSFQDRMRRLEDALKANDAEGRRKRGDAIRVNWEMGFGDLGILSNRRLTFRVKAGREVAA